MDELHAIPDDTGRGERMIRFLLEHLRDRSLLIVVENLDEVFAALKTEGQEKLRAFLQEHRVASTLATTTQFTPAMSGRAEPFFGFFQSEVLKPLSADDATELLRKIASVSGNDELRAFLESAAGHSRVRAIRHLSGGSHRVYIALSEFLTREALDDLVSAFNELLDQLTPYYQDRLKALSPQQREIVEHLCKRQYTTPVKDIARALFIPETTASSQLKQLRDLGYVVSNTVGREARYELAEPLMRLCVELKEDRGGPIPLIVEFLRVWYDRDRCATWLLALPPDTDQVRIHLEATLRAFDAGGEECPRAALLMRAFEALSPEEQGEQVGAFVREFEATAPSRLQRLSWAQMLINARRPHEALSAFDCGDFDQDGYFFACRGHLLLALGRHEEAEESFARAVVGLPDEAVLWDSRGDNLTKLGRLQEALTAYERATTLAPDLAEAWNGLARVLFQLHRIHECLEAVERGLVLNPKDPVLWLIKATVLFFDEQLMAALAAVEEVIAVDPDFAHAQGIKGMILFQLGQTREAIEPLTRGLRSKPDEVVPLHTRGCAYADIGDDQAALADLTRAVNLQPRLASMGDLAAVLVRRGQWEDALTLLRTRFQLQMGNAPKRTRSSHHVSLVNAVLTGTTVRATWKERLGALVALFNEGGALTDLGVELVASLGRFPAELLTGELIGGWVELWRELAQAHDPLSIPVRMYEVGLRYLRTKDERVLLDLLQEERRALRSALNLPPEDGADG